MRARKLATADLPPAGSVSAYHVRFWADGRDRDGADDWEVDDVTADELLAWAFERRAGRTITVWARADLPGGGSAEPHSEYLVLLDEHRRAS